MALTPLNIDRSRVIINDVIIGGMVSASVNLQNETFVAQNTSQKTFYRDLTKKSSLNASFSKIASTYDFNNTIKNDLFSTETLSSIKILSEIYGDTYYGVQGSDAIIDDLNISVAQNEYISLSYSCIADESSALSQQELSVENQPENYTSSQVTEVTGYQNNYMTTDMFSFSGSNSVLSYPTSLSLGVSTNKSLIRGLFAPSKKIWTNSSTYTLNISVNDINKIITQDPTTIDDQSFLLTFYYDENKTNKMAEISLNNCVLTNYTEGLSERGASQTNLTYSFVDDSVSGAFTFYPEVTLPAA